MAEIKVLRGRPEDVPVILEIQKECRLSAWTAGGYLAEMGRLDSILLVCTSAETNVVGFIVGRILPAIADGKEREAEIYNIGTFEDFRAKGIGSQLITSFIDLCRNRDVARIWLEVRVSNLVAKSFYKKHGFVRHSSRTQFYSDPVEDAEVMYLRL